MQELKILEDGFEQSILREDLTTAGTTGRLTNPVDVNLLDIPLVDQNAKFEVLSLLPYHLTTRLIGEGGAGSITPETG